ncbi:MAG: DUF4105 domain-containing protein [Muribaculaceae bacterium]
MKTIIRNILLSVLTLLATCGNAVAAVSDTIISIVNFYPGQEIFELEGHTALRVRMPNNDMAVSYGMFSFDDPNFVYRFVKGETDYWVGVVPWAYFAENYELHGRRIVEHQLNMSAEQRNRLLELLDENLKPENRVYRYNYIFDNCATRPLRIVELAMGDSIVLGNVAPDMAEDATFRDVMRHYHRNYPWYQFGIDLCLGPGIDRAMTNRERSFAPVVLDAQLLGAKVAGKPLVANTIVLNNVAEDEAVDGPTPWYLTPMSVFVLLLIIAILLTFRDVRRRKVTRWFDTILFFSFFVEGCIIFYLVTVSTHEATTPNWLIVWLNPLCIIPAVCEWIKRAEKLLIWYQIINFAVLLLLVVAWPWLGQSANPAFVPMIATTMIRSASYVYITRNKESHKSN